MAVKPFLPARGLSDVGAAALLDAALSLALLALVLFVATGAGLALLGRFAPTGLTSLEMFCFAIPLGLGTLGYLELGLGLAGMLTSLWTGSAFLIVGILCRRHLATVADSAFRAIRRALLEWRHLSGAKRGLVAASGILMIIDVLMALTPVWDYDALMYHMEGPRLFLQAQRVFPSSTRWFIDYPFTMEMLFTLGMALGSDTFPRLLHLTLASLLVVSLFAMTRRLFGSQAAWFALVVMLSMPVIPVWARTADIDFGWATFELLGVYAVILWTITRSRRMLVLGGVFFGLAMGTKYLAIAGVASVLLLIMWCDRKRGIWAAAQSMLTLALPTALVASPWYLKNWLWLGDPLFPFLGGGTQVDPDRLGYLLATARTCRGDLGVIDCILVPVRLYTRPGQFADVLLSPPSLLFPLALLLPLLKRPAVANHLAGFVLLRFIFLLGGPMATRYLLPIYSALAMVTGYTISRLWTGRAKARVVRLPLGVLMAGSLIVTMVVQVGSMLAIRPLGVVVGYESRDSFLRRRVPTYAAMAFAARSLPIGSKLLATGDGRTYYCFEMCMDTDDQFLWWNIIMSSESAEDFEASMHAQGATHLLVSWTDLAFFSSPDNPYEGIQPAIEFLVEEVLARCGQELYADENAAVYSIDCPGPEAWAPFLRSQD
jgi:hypothetical protein